MFRTIMNHSCPEKNYVIRFGAFEKTLGDNFPWADLRNTPYQEYMERSFLSLFYCSSSTQSQVIQMNPGKIWIH